MQKTLTLAALTPLLLAACAARPTPPPAQAPPGERLSTDPAQPAAARPEAPAQETAQVGYFVGGWT